MDVKRFARLEAERRRAEIDGLKSRVRLDMPFGKIGQGSLKLDALAFALVRP